MPKYEFKTVLEIFTKNGTNMGHAHYLKTIKSKLITKIRHFMVSVYKDICHWPFTLVRNKPIDTS